MIVDTNDGAKYLGITPALLRRLARAGRVRHAHLGRELRFRSEDLDELFTQ